MSRRSSDRSKSLACTELRTARLRSQIPWEPSNPDSFLWRSSEGRAQANPHRDQTTPWGQPIDSPSTRHEANMLHRHPAVEVLHTALRPESVSDSHYRPGAEQKPKAIPRYLSY